MKKIRNTSLPILDQLKEKNSAKAQVIDVDQIGIAIGQHYTDYEISKNLGYDDPNYVRQRRNALMNAGILEAQGKRKYTFTGKTVSTWRFTSSFDPSPKKSSNPQKV